MNVAATIPSHPAADLFPMLDDARLAELAADIHENGLREPIQLLDGAIIDGRNRYRACQMAGVQPQFRQIATDINPWALVWSLNGQRRDLSADQRYILWAECAENDKAWQAEQKRIQDEARRKMSEAKIGNDNASKSKNKDNSATTCGTVVSSKPKPEAKPNRTTETKAQQANVDRGTVERNDYLKKHRPDLHEKVKNGELTSSRAYTAAKKDQKVAALTDISAQEVKAAQGVYDVIVLDPPWPMEKIERDVRPNQAAFDYPTMSEVEMAALELPSADDCHVWVWTTQKFMPMAFRLLDAWGLKYVCTFVWHKPGGFQPIGLPQYNSEFALYARKGAPVFLDTKAFPTCFDAPRGAHSEKPEIFYQTLRRVTAGRRLDMFNRRPIEGFDGWGKEAA
jgi:N6-adenosine-specific RNA methylase IME4